MVWFEKIFLERKALNFATERAGEENRTGRVSYIKTSNIFETADEKEN